MAATVIRWGRIVVGGLLAEAILIVIVIPMRLAGSGETPITLVAVAGSFLVFLPMAWWLTQPLARPILHGALMGGAATAICLVLSGLQQRFDPNAPPVPLIYYLAHALKVAGGATGGWLVRRSRDTNAPTSAGVG